MIEILLILFASSAAGAMLLKQSIRVVRAELAERRHRAWLIEQDKEALNHARIMAVEMFRVSLAQAYLLLEQGKLEEDPSDVSRWGDVSLLRGFREKWPLPEEVAAVRQRELDLAEQKHIATANSEAEKQERQREYKARRMAEGRKKGRKYGFETVYYRIDTNEPREVRWNGRYYVDGNEAVPHAAVRATSRFADEEPTVHIDVDEHPDKFQPYSTPPTKADSRLIYHVGGRSDTSTTQNAAAAATIAATSTFIS